MKDRATASRIRILIVVGLAVAVSSVYMRVGEFDFLHYGDDSFVVSNPLVNGGFAWNTLAMAPWSFSGGRWSPVATVSHGMDVRWLGSSSRLHHLENMLWHALIAGLLFLILNRATRLPLRSSIVALLFAVHPLTVESVAWVSGRGTLLAAFFLFLGLSAHSNLIALPQIPRRAAAIVAVLAACAASPAGAGAPFFLIGFAALSGHNPKRIKFKRSDWLVLAIASVGSLALNVQGLKSVGRLSTLQEYPVADRIADIIGHASSISLHALWPSGLAPIYPGYATSGFGTLAGACLWAMLGALAWEARFRAPALFAGACWFAGAMLPAALLTLSGYNGASDAPAYLALIGVLIGGIFGLPQLFPSRQWNRLGAFAALAAILPFASTASRQVMVWRTDITLFRHAIAVTRSNAAAEEALGNGFRRHSFYNEAIEAYRRGIAIGPSSFSLYCNLGTAYARAAFWSASAEAFRHAQAAASVGRTAGQELAAMEMVQARFAAQSAKLEAALAASPDQPDLVRELGNIYSKHGPWQAALDHYNRYADIYGETRHRLVAAIHAQSGDLAAALAEYDTAIAIEPGVQDLYYQRARILYRMGREIEARDEMLRLSHEEPSSQDAWLYLHLVFGE